MSLCPEGFRLYRGISESAHPINRTFHERRNTQRAALDGYQVHTQTCPLCGAPERIEKWHNLPSSQKPIQGDSLTPGAGTSASAKAEVSLAPATAKPRHGHKPRDGSPESVTAETSRHKQKIRASRLSYERSPATTHHLRKPFELPTEEAVLNV